MTQSLTKCEAFGMIADAIESLVNQEGFTIKVYTGKGTNFELGASDLAALCAFLLRQQQRKQGLTLTEVTKRLGATSNNAYARYEQGRSIPTVQKLSQLFAAVSAHRDSVVVENEA